MNYKKLNLRAVIFASLLITQPFIANAQNVPVEIPTEEIIISDKSPVILENGSNVSIILTQAEIGGNDVQNLIKWTNSNTNSKSQEPSFVSVEPQNTEGQLSINSLKITYTFADNANSSADVWSLTVNGVETSISVTVKSVTPEVTTPEVTTPEVTTPEVTTPEVTTPEVTTPEVTTPEVTTPEVTTPEVTTPEVTTPEVTTPEVTTPEVTTPEVTTPEVTTPEVTTPEVTTPEVTTPEATLEEAIQIIEEAEINVATPELSKTGGDASVTLAGFAIENISEDTIKEIVKWVNSNSESKSEQPVFVGLQIREAIISLARQSNPQQTIDLTYNFAENTNDSDDIWTLHINNVPTTHKIVITTKEAVDNVVSVNPAVLNNIASIPSSGFTALFTLVGLIVAGIFASRRK